MESPFAPSIGKPVIAVAGATGHLGTRLTNTFLSPALRNRLSGFVSLALRHTPSTEEWTDLGAEVRPIENDSDENDLVMALDGVDVLVNATSTAGTTLRDNLASALPKISEKLYFPSEFGVDHTLHDFNITAWDGKKKHYELTKKAVQGTDVQVCRLFVGLFLHNDIAPWYGFHTSKDVYQAAGSVDQNVSYTDISDVAGWFVDSQNKLFRQIVQTITAAGAGDIELRDVELEDYRDKALQGEYKDSAAIPCLRFIMGDGRGDYRPKDEGGLGNDNEVVNPGEKQFAWKTVNDLAVETKGRPNDDA